MPVMDGIRATKKILQYSTNQVKPKIIAVTAFASDEEMQKTIDVGMWDFKTKPIDSEWYKDILIDHGPKQTFFPEHERWNERQET